MFCLHACLCKGVRSLGTAGLGSGELPCGCWELNSGPLEEQSVLPSAEPLLQLPDSNVLMILLGLKNRQAKSQDDWRRSKFCSLETGAKVALCRHLDDANYKVQTPSTLSGKAV